MDGCVVAVAEIQHKSQFVAFCISAGEHRSAKDAVLLSANGVQRVPGLLHQLTTLPPYMIPAIWLPFSSFPTLPSGKTNRKKLVALVEGMESSELSTYLQFNQSSANSRPVETEEERIISKCWAMVLDEPEDSIQANGGFRQPRGRFHLRHQCGMFGLSLVISGLRENRLHRVETLGSYMSQSWLVDYA